jgi:hypothetical protein
VRPRSSKKEGEAQILDGFVDREERGVGKLLVEDAGRHVDASDPRPGGHPVQLRQGRFRLGHGQHGKAEKPFRVGFMGGDAGLVVGFGQPPGEIGRGPVDHGLSQGQHMDVHALVVHGGHPRLQIVVAGIQRRGLHASHVDDRPARVAIGARHAELGALFGDQLQVTFRIKVRVDVDGLEFAHVLLSTDISGFRPGCGNGTGAAGPGVALFRPPRSQSPVVRIGWNARLPPRTHRHGENSGTAALGQ